MVYGSQSSLAVSFTIPEVRIRIGTEGGLVYGANKEYTYIYVAEGVIFKFFPVNFDSCSAPVWQNSQGAQSSMFQLLILGVQCIVIYSIV